MGFLGLWWWPPCVCAFVTLAAWSASRSSGWLTPPRYHPGVRRVRRDGSSVDLASRHSSLGNRFSRYPDRCGYSHLEVPTLRDRHSHKPYPRLRGSDGYAGLALLG